MNTHHREIEDAHPGSRTGQSKAADGNRRHRLTESKNGINLRRRLQAGEKILHQGTDPRQTIRADAKICRGPRPHPLFLEDACAHRPKLGMNHDDPVMGSECLQGDTGTHGRTTARRVGLEWREEKAIFHGTKGWTMVRV